MLGVAQPSGLKGRCWRQSVFSFMGTAWGESAIVRHAKTHPALITADVLRLDKVRNEQSLRR